MKHYSNPDLFIAVDEDRQRRERARLDMWWYKVIIGAALLGIVLVGSFTYVSLVTAYMP